MSALLRLSLGVFGAGGITVGSAIAFTPSPVPIAATLAAGGALILAGAWSMAGGLR